MSEKWERLFRFEYRHRFTDRCDRRGWHPFCEAVNRLDCTYKMRTLPRTNTPRLIIAAALLDDEWWPAGGEAEAVQLATKIAKLLRRARVLK